MTPPRNEYTRLTFKKRVARKMRTNMAHHISRRFAVKMTHNGLIIRHEKEDFRLMFSLFVFAGKIFSSIQ